MNHRILQVLITQTVLFSLFILLFAPPQLAYTTANQLPPFQIINEKIALTNVTLIDGYGGKPRPMTTLIVSGGRIADIFMTGSRTIPSNARIMDLSGKFVIPGLIDTHVHLKSINRPPEIISAVLRNVLMGGVTSVRDMGGNGLQLAKLAADAKNGTAVSPRIYYSTLITGPDSNFWLEDEKGRFVSGEKAPPGTTAWFRHLTAADTDLVRVISEAKAYGATGIKIHSGTSGMLLKQLTEEARRQGLKVWSHGVLIPGKPSDAVNAGVEVLTHADMLAFEGLSSLSKDSKYSELAFQGANTTPVESAVITNLLRNMKKHRTIFEPTLFIMTPQQEPPASDQNWQRFKVRLDHAYRVTRRANEMGIEIAAGTDAIGGSSPNLHAELQLLVKKSGLTPLEAITAATHTGAKVIGIEKDYGTLEVGKVADLVILTENPAEDIRNTQTVEAVMQGGKIYKREQPIRTPPLAEPPVSTRIRNVENGLLPAVVIKGKKNEMSLAERIRFYKTPAVSIAVVNNGRIEWAKGYGNLEAGGNQLVTPVTLFQAGSISKPVAAVTALQLVEKGKLNLDDDVNLKLKSWKVPENEFTKDKKVTVRGLVTHSAGLTVHGFDGYAASENPPTLLQILNGEKPANSPPIRVDFAPGSKERYSGGGYTVLQQLLLDTTRKSFPDLTRENIFQKIGMTRTTYASLLPKTLAGQAASGHRGDGGVLPGKWHIYPEMAAASLWSTPSDLARFVIELQNSYAGQSDGILSKDMTQQMLTRQNKSIANSDAGLGIFLKGSPEPFRFSHNGSTEGFCAIMVGFLKTGQGAVVMTNSDNGAELTTEILRSIAKEYGWDDMKPDEIAIVEANPTVYEKYVGRYKFPSGLEFIVTSENGRLFVARTNGWRAELLPESETSYFVVMPTAPRLVFVKNERDEFNEVVFKRGGREEIGQRLK
ncbi:MAG: serine hydrolase [Acidobacteria bacterium]|nr:serine hydrolase [Acidobacteriota bacterium]MCA1637254.1 serine hydrolase [Acidobacteriota bacterium]